jgi:hypothetical protein
MGANDSQTVKAFQEAEAYPTARRSSSPTATASPTATTWSTASSSRSSPCNSGYWPLIRRMEDAGASAIVLTSLFEEQLALESRALDEDLSRGTDSFAESLGFLPDLDRLPHDPGNYLEHLRRAREAVKPFPSWPASTAPR